LDVADEDWYVVVKVVVAAIAVDWYVDENLDDAADSLK